MKNSTTTAKISIIITTYNAVKYIAETIESVINQTRQNWELIIVDDGSEDSTCEMISLIKDDRIQLYKAGRIGVNGRVKNIALGKVTGEPIAFIDQDDCWGPEKLEKQFMALQQYPNAGFCLCGGYNFYKKGIPTESFYKHRSGIKYDSIFTAIFRSEITLFTQALLLRKECLAVAGNFAETKSFTDVDFIIRLAWHFKAIVIYEPLVYRRLHKGNYHTANWEKSYYETVEMIHTYRKEKMLSSNLSRNVLFNIYINLGEKYLLYKQRAKAVNSFLKAWVNSPFSIVPIKKSGKAALYFFTGK